MSDFAKGFLEMGQLLTIPVSSPHLQRTLTYSTCLFPDLNLFSNFNPVVPLFPQSTPSPTGKA